MKVLIIAAGGLLAGVGVAAALFMFVLGGGDSEANALSTDPTPEPTPVVVEGKLGPHITLEDRVYTLRSPASDPRYVRLAIVIEFETFAEEWAHVLHGCVFAFVEESDVSPCKAEEETLLHEFEEEIGTGKALIEDAITTVVSGKSYEELSTSEGREELRAEILHSVGELIHEPEVTRVLFLEFLTQ